MVKTEGDEVDEVPMTEESLYQIQGTAAALTVSIQVIGDTVKGDMANRPKTNISCEWNRCKYTYNCCLRLEEHNGRERVQWVCLLLIDKQTHINNLPVLSPEYYPASSLTLSPTTLTWILSGELRVLTLA